MTAKNPMITAFFSLPARLFGKGSPDGEGIGKFMRNSSLQLTSTMIITGAAFLQTILMARYLGVGNYGLLAIVMTYSQFIGQFISCSMWEAVIKYGAEFMVHEQHGKFLATVKLGYVADIVAGALALLVSIAAAGLAATIVFHEPAMKVFVYAYLPIQFMGFMDNTSNAILRVYSRFDLLAKRDIFLACARLISVWVMLLLSPGLREVILALTCITLIQVMANLTMAFKLVGCGPLTLMRTARLSCLKDSRGEIARFLLNNYLTQSWCMVIANIDVIILGHFRNTTEVGLYRMAKNFYNLLARVVEPFNIVIYPDLAKLWAARSYSSFLELVKRGTAVVSIFTTPLLAFVVLCIPYILRFVAGEEFAQAAVPTRLLAFGAWVAAIFFWTRPAILVMDKAHVPNIVNFFNAVIVISLSFLIVPKFGALGSAAVYIVPIILGNVIVGLCAFRNFRTVAGER